MDLAANQLEAKGNLKQQTNNKNGLNKIDTDYETTSNKIEPVNSP